MQVDATPPHALSRIVPLGGGANSSIQRNYCTPTLLEVSRFSRRCGRHFSISSYLKSSQD